MQGIASMQCPMWMDHSFVIRNSRSRGFMAFIYQVTYLLCAKLVNRKLVLIIRKLSKYE